VIELVLERTAYGWSPEELHFQHPFLTLGQIYSALAYYYDNQEKIEDDIERRLRLVDQIRREGGPSPLAERLKAKGIISHRDTENTEKDKCFGHLPDGGGSGFQPVE
jgi:hypothetical protein